MDTNTCPTKEDVKKVRKAAKKFKAGGGACADAATLLMAKRMTVHFLGWAFKVGALPTTTVRLTTISTS